MPPGAVVQVTRFVTSLLLESLKVPVAVNCWVCPTVRELLAGVTEIEAIVAEPTVRDALALTFPEAAVIVTWPAATVVASPAVGEELLIVAIAPFPVLQCTELVTSWVEESLNVAVALNCWVRPSATVLEAGVTAMDTIAAGVTVNKVEPLIEPTTAFTTELPCEIAVAKP